MIFIQPANLLRLIMTDSMILSTNWQRQRAKIEANPQRQKIFPPRNSRSRISNNSNWIYHGYSSFCLCNGEYGFFFNSKIKDSNCFWIIFCRNWFTGFWKSNWGIGKGIVPQDGLDALPVQLHVHLRPAHIRREELPHV